MKVKLLNYITSVGLYFYLSHIHNVGSFNYDYNRHYFKIYKRQIILGNIGLSL